MQYDECKLAELIATRISHDLAGGIGSLSNMLECLEAGENLLEEDKNILDNVAENLKARQQFLRVAFGVATKSLSAEELQELCEKYLSTIGSRTYEIKLNLKNAVSELAKYICLCVMCASEIVIKGADIEVEVNKNNIIVSVISKAKLATAKIAAYKQILKDRLPDEGEASQLVALIYLHKVLGGDVPFKIQDDTENSFVLTIG